MSETASQKYLRHRHACRETTAEEFFSRRPGTDRVLASANELVASLVLFISGRDLRHIPHGGHVGDLLVSFCRSHFVIADLLVQGELIEAATLLRKQMELVSRLNELGTVADIDELIGKTPNIKHLREELRRMYGEYSEVAHSSHPRSLQFLGTLEEDSREYTALYPVFHENLHAGLSHLVLVTAEFFRWTTVFYERNFPEYVQDSDRAIVKTLVECFNEVFPAEEDC